MRIAEPLALATTPIVVPIPSPHPTEPFIVSPAGPTHLRVAVTRFPIPTIVGVTLKEQAVAVAATTVSLVVAVNVPATFTVVSVAAGVIVYVPGLE